ncbi:nucleotidyltransferase family protein [Paenibacillus alkalitolerans]|uniref:nucleotidyltransferase family protein n=1 Tax=Paenibacillus alkalitolerans TaxID=2799335 RepID=UPI0018F328F5|nr:nucleotidyltransferase family protein [Paenibacillus alkalitolerans]
MNGMKNILDILKWAGGGKQDIHHSKEIDEEKLLDLIDFHRLDTRLLFRLKDECPPWLNSRILSHLEKQYEIAVRDLELKISFMEQYIEAYKSDKKPIAVKGFTNYLLTGEHKFVRRRGDLDLFCHDPEFNRSVLESLGYISLVVPSAEYELGNYRPANDKNGIHLDFHKYFPVYQYPKDIMNCYDPLIHKLPVRQEERIPKQKKIMYEDLLEYSVPSIKNIDVIKPSMSVLVSSAHLFKTYLKVKRLPVKLSELSDIGDLTCNGIFDEKEFHDLVVKFDAFDSVEFVCYLYNNLYHYIPEKLQKYCMNKEYKIKKQLPSARIWGYFDAAEDLIVPKNLYEGKVKDQVLKLKANNYITAAKDQEEFRYRLFSFDENETELKGVFISSLHNNIDGLIIGVGCSISGEDLRVSINLKVKQVTDIKVDLQMDRDCRHSYFIGSEGRLNWQKGVGSLICQYKDDDVELTSVYGEKHWKINLIENQVYAILYIKIIRDGQPIIASIPLVIMNLQDLSSNNTRGEKNVS